MPPPAMISVTLLAAAAAAAAVFSLLLLIPSTVWAKDTLSAGEFLPDGKTLVSAGSVFELGFFTPGRSTYRYVGIWYYNFSTDTVLWVANRESPVHDSAGSLAVGRDGNLLVLDGTGSILWSSNVTLPSNRTAAQLGDDGNVVLKLTTGDTPATAWQSFDWPTDTYLPGMKVGLDLRTNVNQLFTSWKTPDDPAAGNFSMGIDPGRSTQIFLWEGTKPRWRSGRWNGQVFISIPNMVPTYIYGFKLSNFEQEQKMYFYYNAFNSSHRYVLTPEGIEMHLIWKPDTRNWTRFWAQPVTQCELYNMCGDNAGCRDEDTPICSCLKGYVPVSSHEWDQGIWSSGCRRRAQFQCERNQSRVGSVSTKAGDPDGFWLLQGVKLPDLSDWNPDLVNETNCQQSCASNCSCKAYAIVSGIGCLMWGIHLIDVHMFSSGGNDMYLRLASSEFGGGKSTIPAWVIVIIVLAIVLLLGFLYLLWKCRRRIRGFAKPREDVAAVNQGREDVVPFTGESMSIRNKSGQCPHLSSQKELPLLEFDFIATITDNFSNNNLLGMGGFGIVYKGTFPDGQEVAVKRLSRSSGQGVEEFKNEVILIAKLQHRNLVRLLGCSIQDEEKLLIYEYMSNRSLDAFLFGSRSKEFLDWKTRYNIVEGVARGLLYLHRDSRLRIIHRDLKASNILLDGEMNPKISDFGMARIFGRDDNESNTKRVVGTYGYMAPEYAMHGLFSVKSDVYSFGVLLLEAVSGKKNSTFLHTELSLNLLSYAWKLWNDHNVTEFVDPKIRDSCSLTEVSRCVYAALLCVQDRAIDRPTMPSVVIMLESGAMIEHSPKPPTFATDRSPSETESATFDQGVVNIDSASITMLIGR